MLSVLIISLRVGFKISKVGDVAGVFKKRSCAYSSLILPPKRCPSRQHLVGKVREDVGACVHGQER